VPLRTAARLGGLCEAKWRPKADMNSPRRLSAWGAHHKIVYMVHITEPQGRRPKGALIPHIIASTLTLQHNDLVCPTHTPSYFGSRAINIRLPFSLDYTFHLHLLRSLSFTIFLRNFSLLFFSFFCLFISHLIKFIYCLIYFFIHSFMHIVLIFFHSYPS